MPRDPPVTSATLPVSCVDSVIPILVSSCRTFRIGRAGGSSSVEASAKAEAPPRAPIRIPSHMRAAIVGAGDLGGAIAAALAGRDRCRDIQLIDEAGSMAAGKALDIQQSAPVHRSAARLTGSTDLGAVSGADAIVLADRPGGPGMDWSGEAGLTLVRRLAGVNPGAPIVCAGTSQDWLIEHAVSELGLDWTSIVGSAPIALEAAVRALIALDASTSAQRVVVRLAGRPPGGLMVAWDSTTIDGAPAAARLDPRTMARLIRRLPYLWPPGPIALAEAAAVAVEGLTRGSHVPQHALVALGRPGLPRRRAVMASVRFTIRRVASATLADLPPSTLVALDNLLAR